MRVVSGTDTDITGATAGTYMPVLADVGKTLKVEVSFTDDASNTEGPLTSAVTTAVLDTPPTVSIAGESRSEGDGEVEFTISIDGGGASDRAFSVSLSTSNGTATAGVDYEAVTGRIVQIASGTFLQTTTIDVTDDNIDEANETFTVTMTINSGTATIGTGTATGTILDDDTAGVTVSKTVLTVTEEDTTGDTYTVVLDSERTANVVIAVGGTASTDVSVTPTPLTFTPTNWDTAQTVTVKAATDVDTANDSVTLTHTATSTDANYSGISIGNVVVTVIDNDSANTPATGVPAITGTPQVGKVLTAGLGTIADYGGLPATFPDDYTLQWVRVASGTGTDITGATAGTYTPVAADVGKTIRVDVSFTDDANNSEGPLPSAATAAAVAAAGACPDGSTTGARR